VNRPNPRKDKAHTEFHYGSFERSFVLPIGAREETMSASYDKGILMVTVKVADPVAHRRPIKITIGAPAPTAALPKVAHKK
jgi:HSP20 family protein